MTDSDVKEVQDKLASVAISKCKYGCDGVAYTATWNWKTSGVVYVDSLCESHYRAWVAIYNMGTSMLEFSAVRV